MGSEQFNLLQLSKPTVVTEIENRTIHQDLFAALDFLPAAFADLVFIDPPYNLNKTFRTNQFRAKPVEEYAAWLETWLARLIRVAKPQASIYICGDWRSSPAIHLTAAKYLKIHNRITWEREKGRGAKSNWKSASEDIYFWSISDTYTFNLDAVKVHRRVIAPYRDKSGQPKDWNHETNSRLTHPSNLWTDLTVPFWSMAENTDHPTQKPEKLLAKIILASSNPGDLVFDPFLGSGTTSVVAKKLGRRYVGIEADEHFCKLAEHRLSLADADKTIQGFKDGVFRERNS